MAHLGGISMVPVRSPSAATTSWGGRVDDDDGVLAAVGAEGDAVAEVDLDAVGGVGEDAEGGAVFADGEDPRVGRCRGSCRRPGTP
jgi:hypothetical protein